MQETNDLLCMLFNDSSTCPASQIKPVQLHLQPKFSAGMTLILYSLSCHSIIYFLIKLIPNNLKLRIYLSKLSNSLQYTETGSGLPLLETLSLKDLQTNNGMPANTASKLEDTWEDFGFAAASRSFKAGLNRLSAQIL